MIDKGEFLSWSKNGVGPNAWLEVLEAQYADLAAAYRSKGMKREAQLFANIVGEFKILAKEVRELSVEQFP